MCFGFGHCDTANQLPAIEPLPWHLRGRGLPWQARVGGRGARGSDLCCITELQIYCERKCTPVTRTGADVHWDQVEISWTSFSSAGLQRLAHHCRSTCERIWHVCAPGSSPRVCIRVSVACITDNPANSRMCPQPADTALVRVNRSGCGASVWGYMGSLCMWPWHEWIWATHCFGNHSSRQFVFMNKAKLNAMAGRDFAYTSYITFPYILESPSCSFNKI